MIENGKIIRIEDDFVFVEMKNNEFCSKCWRCIEEFEDEEDFDFEDDVDYNDFEE